MASGTNKIVELGKLDDESVVIILEERLGFQPSCKYGSQMPLRLFLHQISTLATPIAKWSW